MSDKLFDKYILNQYNILTNTNKPLLYFGCFPPNKLKLVRTKSSPLLFSHFPDSISSGCSVCMLWDTKKILECMPHHHLIRTFWQKAVFFNKFLCLTSLSCLVCLAGVALSYCVVLCCLCHPASWHEKDSAPAVFVGNNSLMWCGRCNSYHNGYHRRSGAGVD